MPGVSVWIERISALYRNLMRRFANDNGLQPVHLEIITYLNLCNHYSNTVQAISDYLGQTKGSISQSVTLLEENSFIQKKQAESDKRVFHLQLTQKGKNLAKAFKENIQFDFPLDPETETTFEQALRSLQFKNNSRQFGICKSCSYNQILGKNKFRCGLTMESLSKDDIEKLCGEFQHTS